LPDAVIEVSARKAEEEAIAEAMDDDDNTASANLGAEDGEHTSFTRH
jgi:hypothetical protein